MFLIGGVNVNNSIMKAIHYGQIVNVMYMAKDGQISERKIKPNTMEW